MSNTYIRTYTGKKFEPLDPNPDLICIEDIAHALANVCRYTGHTKQFYSVAEHSVRVALQCSQGNRLWGLMHDASEAYICDIARPLKYTECFALYREAEHRLMDAIAHKFGLPRAIPKEVHEKDRLLLRTEQRDLMQVEVPDEPVLADKIVPWTPEVAESFFLTGYNAFRGA